MDIEESEHKNAINFLFLRLRAVFYKKKKKKKKKKPGSRGSRLDKPFQTWSIIDEPLYMAMEIPASVAPVFLDEICLISLI